MRQTAPPAGPVLRLGVRVLAIELFLALVCIRIPPIIRFGRFWAEEGTIYFLHAWTMPWWRALLMPANGYLSLLANAAGVAARLAPLREAPHVTTAVALAVQTLPAILLATARDGWLQRPTVLLSAMLLLSMPPVCDEVWLNTANSQFHLAVAAALCLVLGTPAGVGAAAVRRLLVFLTPLCSPGSVALAPLFVLRAAVDRQMARTYDAAAIVAGSAIQFLAFYSATPGRGHILGPSVLLLIVSVKHLAIPLLGEQAAERLAADIHAQLAAGRGAADAVGLTAAGVGLIAIAVALRRRPEPFWLFASGGALAVLSYDGALASGPDLITTVLGNRYAFAPSVLFALGILSLAATAWRPDRVALCAWAAVVWLVAISVQQTVLPQDGMFVDGPSWTVEVAAWRADPNHALAIWPTGWAVRLPSAGDGAQARPP